MNLPWIRVHKALPRHPKSDELARLTGVERAWTHVLELWLWAGDMHPDGKLGDVHADVVAMNAGWPVIEGAQVSFMDALKAVGFVDADGTIHDWHEHAEAHVDAAGDDADRKARVREQARVRQARARERKAGAMPASRVTKTAQDGVSGRESAKVRDVTHDVTLVTRDVTQVTRDASVTRAAVVTPREHARAKTETKTETYVEEQQPVGVVVDGDGQQTLAGLPPPPRSFAPDVERVWARYALLRPLAKRSPEREELILDWLKVYTAGQLVTTIDGYAKSPYHNGENDRRTKYLSIELFFRDEKHIEDGWDYDRTLGPFVPSNPPPAQPPKKTSSKYSTTPATWTAPPPPERKP